MSARRRIALAASLTLAACSSGGVISYQDPANSSDIGEIRAALNGQVTPVSVVHNPFPGLSDQQVAERVAAATPTGFLGSARFTGDPSQASQTAYRIVWDFAAANAYGGDGGCGSPPAPAGAAPGGGTTDVHGTISLCRSGGPMTRAYGYVNQVSGPDDGKFRTFVSQMTTEILLYPMPAGGAGGGSTIR